jgi:hypothetical protein
MKARALLLVVSMATWAMAPQGAMAQLPTQLSVCVQDGSDVCLDVSVGDYWDPTCGARYYSSFRGRIAWRPLLYVGPITLEVLAHTTPGTRYPIYFEVVPLAGRDPTLGYCDGPGEILEAVPGRGDCDWGTFGPISLGLLGLEPGDAYFVRAHFIGDPDGDIQSPFIACVRVKPATAPIAPSSWGSVKELYK